MLRSFEGGLSRKPFYVEIKSSESIVHDGYSNPVDFWTNVQHLRGWNGESIDSGKWECKIEQFLMPNNVESFNTFGLAENKSTAYINVVMETKRDDAKTILHRDSYTRPHRNWKVRDAVEWVNVTIRNTWSNKYTRPNGGRNVFGEFLVEHLCTGEVDSRSEFVQWNTHPQSADVYAEALGHKFEAYKRTPLNLGHFSKMWILGSDSLASFLGGELSKRLPYPWVESIAENSKCVWMFDINSKMGHPFVHFTKSTVPGLITSLVVKTNIINGQDELNELCRCAVPTGEQSCIDLGYGTGAAWKTLKSSASLQALHLVVNADDGRRLPFKGGIIYYLLHANVARAYSNYWENWKWQIALAC